MNIERYILNTLKPYANSERAADDLHYKKSQFPTLGCKSANIHKVAKQLFKQLDTQQSVSETRKQLAAVWQSTNSHDVMSICLEYFAYHVKDLTLHDWRLLTSWSAKIDNWAHSDQLSNIYAKLLEQFPKQIYPTFVTWNTSHHPWQRRLSLTSMLYYSSMRKTVLPVTKILALVKPRLSDEHFYVQRAVGWTLRECHNVYPTKTKAFITKHITQLSSIAFSAATEKFTRQEKEPLKQIRKEARRRV